MPVFACIRWRRDELAELDPQAQEPNDLMGHLVPYPATPMQAYTALGCQAENRVGLANGAL